MTNTLYFKRKIKVFFCQKEELEGKIRRCRDKKLETISWSAKPKVQLKQFYQCIFKASER